MSSSGCSVSIHSRAPRTRKKRRQLTTTPCTTPGPPRAHIRTKVLLRHTFEASLCGRVGIDLHLGQKPKLGGGTPTIHSSTYHILSVLCISMFRFLSFLYFLFVCLFSSLALVCFISYFRVVI
jgi:hypothetical protein